MKNPRGEGIRVFLMADHLGHPGGRVHGGTTYFLNTIPLLSNAGLDLTVVFMGPRHPAAEKLEAKGITPHFLDLAKADPRSFTAFLPLLDRKPHDVLHLLSFKSQLAGRLAARSRGIPSVVHVHDHIRMKQPLRFAQQCLGPGTAALVGITESVTEFAMKEYRVPAERCHTIPYGMDVSDFLAVPDDRGPELRPSLNTPADAPLIAVVGRVLHDKGQDQLLRAMPRIIERVPDVELWVVGDGPDRADFEALAEELGVGSSVKFLGQRDDVPAVLAAVDLTVVPSMWEEGLGLVALESLAAGKPVVAFRSGGLPTVVQHDQTGILVERGDLDALSDAVAKLLEDPARRRSLGERGKVHARSFDPELHVERMVDLYSKVIEDRAG